MNWVSFLTEAKGTRPLFQRMTAILKRYDLSSARMARILMLLNGVLENSNCSGTFPITAGALSRHPEIIRLLAEGGMEFAVHGYFHVDHSQLPPEVQSEHLERALAIFRQNGIPCQGFRSPYLRWNDGTLAAIKSHGLLYESNQPLLWDCLNGQPIDRSVQAAYQRVLEFYRAKSAADYLSLPRLEDGLVRIPVTLPDDEILVERLRFTDVERIQRAWGSILERTYKRGEAFILSLHPERTTECHQALANVLAEARSRQPSVWITQLKDLADWWRRRLEAEVQIREVAQGRYSLQLQGPKELTILARGFEVKTTKEPWFADYSRLSGAEFIIEGSHRPFIGVTPQAPGELVAFLKSLGYLVEAGDSREEYALYLDQRSFDEADEKPLVDYIEDSAAPLIRQGLWPNGARSALSVTGDIDALTLWDFGLRVLGR